MRLEGCGWKKRGGSGWEKRDEHGKELYCRCCGDNNSGKTTSVTIKFLAEKCGIKRGGDGELWTCDYCPRAYCYACLIGLIDKAGVKALVELPEDAKWSCKELKSECTVEDSSQDFDGERTHQCIADADGKDTTAAAQKAAAAAVAQERLKAQTAIVQYAQCFTARTKIEQQREAILIIKAACRRLFAHNHLLLALLELHERHALRVLSARFRQAQQHGRYAVTLEQHHQNCAAEDMQRIVRCFIVRKKEDLRRVEQARKEEEEQLQREKMAKLEFEERLHRLKDESGARCCHRDAPADLMGTEQYGQEARPHTCPQTCPHRRLRIFTHMPTHMCLSTYLHTCLYACTHMPTDMCQHTFLYTCLYTCLHTDLHSEL